MMTKKQVLEQKKLKKTSSLDSKKPVCQYDLSCYRKNRQHWQEESHPQYDNARLQYEKKLQEIQTQLMPGAKKKKLIIPDKDKVALKEFRKTHHIDREEHLAFLTKFSLQE